MYSQIKETNHDYHSGIMGNPYDKNCNKDYNSWKDFKENFVGFSDGNYKEYDDKNFVFRYDIEKNENSYSLNIFILLQRTGIYLNPYINK